MFVSYARPDRSFVDRLAGALGERGFEVDWDLDATDRDNIDRGISAEDEWWDRLQQMITAADVVVFVCSPEAAASKVCGDEIRYALELGKRRIPIESRKIDFSTAPLELRALNLKISFVDEFEAPLNDLDRALRVDVGWRREQTWLTGEALRWNHADRSEGILVSGVDLMRAERCAAQRPSDVPALPEVVVDFIEASRQLAAERQAVEDLQRERFIEIEEVTRDLLREELRVRESRPDSAHYGVLEEQRTDIARIRSVLEKADRWHPNPANHIASTGAADGYAEIFEFPCCGAIVKDFRAVSDRDGPSQLRSDGCRPIPSTARYEARRRSNPFDSLLVRQYHAHQSGITETESPDR